jgi:hypothetical protein
MNFCQADTITNPNSYTSVYVRGCSEEFRATRYAVFSEHRQDIIDGRDMGSFYANNAQDVVTLAEACATTLLADQCPVYLVARFPEGILRVISREKFKRFPHRYKQIIN